MPVEGLPNPHIHRLCKRCGRWFQLDEGSLAFPATRGPLKWIRVVAARFTEQDHLKKFFCFPCQELQARAAQRWWLSILIVILMFVAAFIAAQYFGVFQDLHLPRKRAP
jgi:hypothetical protein